MTRKTEPLQRINFVDPRKYHTAKTKQKTLNKGALSFDGKSRKRMGGSAGNISIDLENPRIKNNGLLEGIQLESNCVSPSTERKVNPTV